jgi:hypothetical protein
VIEIAIVVLVALSVIGTVVVAPAVRHRRALAILTAEIDMEDRLTNAPISSESFHIEKSIYVTWSGPRLRWVVEKRPVDVAEVRKVLNPNQSVWVQHYFADDNCGFPTALAAYQAYTSNRH